MRAAVAMTIFMLGCYARIFLSSVEVPCNCEAGALACGLSCTADSTARNRRLGTQAHLLATTIDEIVGFAASASAGSSIVIHLDPAYR